MLIGRLGIIRVCPSSSLRHWEGQLLIFICRVTGCFLSECVTSPKTFDGGIYKFDCGDAV